MTEIDPVTDLRGHYSLPPQPPATWEENVANWSQIALDAWVATAREHGFEVTVLEVKNPREKLVYGVVEVDGRRYAVEQHGRGMEVEARAL